jgi:LPS export ABC transporter permease LptG
MKTYLTRITLPLALAALGALFCVFLVPAEVSAVREQLMGFPDSHAQANQARPWILAGLLFLPSFGALAYSLGGIMDRYIARQFASIFAVCLGALVIIWLLMDLSDKIGDFRESKSLLWTILTFYAARSPSFLLLLLPYSLLLALLYSLGKLSGSREIIAMIQGGRSVIRITLPLIAAGVFFSLLSLGLSYHWAPAAEGRKDDILAEATGKQMTEATNVLFREPASRHLWMIGAFPPDYHKGEPLLNVEITTTREDGSLESRITAKRAFWERLHHRWTFEEAVVGTYQPDEPAIFTKGTEPLVIDGWTETPWQLIKPGLTADYLGVPDLITWLKTKSRMRIDADRAAYETQLFYRLAQPFACLVTVLLATPLGIHFARRGSGGGVFLAVVLSALMLLTSSISISFGEAGLLRPVYAAWFPNLAFAALGVYLFRRRITGQPIYRSLKRLFPVTT